MELHKSVTVRPQGQALRAPSVRRIGANLVPPRQEVVGILGVIVFAIHSWSIRGFLYSLPSFVLKYDTGEILVVFCYHMAFAFLESVCVLAVLLILAAALPAGLLRKGFVPKGFVLVLAASAAAIYLQHSYVSGTYIFVTGPASRYLPQILGGLILAVALYVWTSRSARMRQSLTFLVDQISIMLLIYIPLDVVGLIVVAWRLVR